MARALHASTRTVRIADIEIAHTGGAPGLGVVDDFVSLRICHDLRIGQIPEFLNRRKTTAGFWPFLPPAQVFTTVPAQIAGAAHAVGPDFFRRLFPERSARSAEFKCLAYLGARFVARRAWRHHAAPQRNGTLARGLGCLPKEVPDWSP